MRRNQYWSNDYIKECKEKAHLEANSFANWAAVGNENKALAFIDIYSKVFAVIYEALTAPPTDG